jgi:hypothetical protein
MKAFKSKVMRRKKAKPTPSILRTKNFINPIDPLSNINASLRGVRGLVFLYVSFQHVLVNYRISEINLRRQIMMHVSNDTESKEVIVEKKSDSSMVASTFIKYAAYLIIFFALMYFVIHYFINN